MSEADGPKASGEDFRVSFQPVALAHNFPCEGERDEASERARNMRRGNHRLWGIPFELAPEWAEANVLRLAEGEEAAVKVGATASHLCFLHYWEATYGQGQPEAGCDLVGEYVLQYADGETAAVPIRVMFEVGAGNHPWGKHIYAGVGAEKIRSLDFMNPESRKEWGWGRLQVDVEAGNLGEPWIYALANPRPDAEVASVLLRGKHSVRLCVAGLTLYDGPGHPLRHNPRRYYKLGLPERAEVDTMDVDLGVLVRDAGPTSPRDDEWVGAVEAGLGVPADAPLDEGARLLEISAADGATLTVRSKKLGSEDTHHLSMGEALHRGASEDSGA
ncbi:MAG: hypothetical protein QGH74_09215, partial [Candidatus Brocadiia bacterium]|nr:hypothetical protein [Candidatus Brocadiia bacterium]